MNYVSTMKEGVWWPKGSLEASLEAVAAMLCPLVKSESLQLLINYALL